MKDGEFFKHAALKTWISMRTFIRQSFIITMRFEKAVQHGLLGSDGVKMFSRSLAKGSVAKFLHNLNFFFWKCARREKGIPASLCSRCSHFPSPDKASQRQKASRQTGSASRVVASCLIPLAWRKSSFEDGKSFSTSARVIFSLITAIAGGSMGPAAVLGRFSNWVQTFVESGGGFPFA